MTEESVRYVAMIFLMVTMGLFFLLVLGLTCLGVYELWLMCKDDMEDRKRRKERENIDKQNRIRCEFEEVDT